MSGFRQPLCKVSVGGLELVQELINKAHQKFDIVYDVYLANHLPHGLYTLFSLGGSLERIQEYYDEYVKRLEPLKPAKFKITNWESHIGDKTVYPEFLQFFDQEIKENGLEATFSQYFPKLMGFSLGAALHPLIHIGYAMEYTDPWVLAEGLSYACTYPLQGSSIILGIDQEVEKPTKSATILDIINQVSELDLPVLTNEIGNFHYKTEYLLKNCGETFKNLISSWELPSPKGSLEINLNELTEASILGAFATQPDKIDFFLVHGVTGNHAIRTVFKHLDEKGQRDLLRINLLGLLTDYVVQKRPQIDINHVQQYHQKAKVEKENQEITWNNMITKAVERDEEHIGKVVRSIICYMENVPVSERSPLFTDDFCKLCVFKAIDILKDINDFTFN